MSKSRSGGIISLSLFIKPKSHVYFLYKCDMTLDDSHTVVIHIFVTCIELGFYQITICSYGSREFWCVNVHEQSCTRTRTY